MPRVTLEHVFSATYVTAPESAMFSRTDWIGTTGYLGVLDARYGSTGPVRQICAFVGEEASFITDPGRVTQEGTLLTHIYRTDPAEGILREPLRDDLTGEYINVWQLEGDEHDLPWERETFLEIVKERWRVLRRAELGES